jgi:hypothetical protein
LDLDPYARQSKIDTCGYIDLMLKNVRGIKTEKKKIESSLGARIETFKKSFIEKENETFKRYMLDQEKKFLSVQIDLAESLNDVLNHLFEKLNSLSNQNCPGIALSFSPITSENDKLIQAILNRYTELQIMPDAKPPCSKAE